MFDKIKTFWTAFWASFRDAYNKVFKQPLTPTTQDYRDTQHINFLQIFISKLNDLINNECTYDLESDSKQAEPLRELLQDLENNRFEITAEMLAYGDYWVFPATADDGSIYHHYVPQSDVRILNAEAGEISDIIGVVDKYIDNEGRTFLLNRRHRLDNGTLLVETYTTDENYRRCILEQWAEFEGSYLFRGANHIGVGRFKSPVSSRGLSPIYGVPLNFGCNEIEQRIFNDLSEIEKEFKNARSIVFADPLILRKNSKADEWDIPENIFPIDTRGGQNSANIDSFTPEIRYSAYRDKLMDDLHSYEQQIGTDRGFLTPYENASATTATEIRRANASTIALIGRIQSALDQGVEDTIKADCVFLNIPEDLYTLKIDFYDVFADPESQYNRLKEAAENGYAEAVDVMQWLFPNMTIEELEEKRLRILSEKQEAFNNAHDMAVKSAENEGEGEENDDEREPEKM